MLGKYAKKNTKTRVILGIVASCLIIAFSTTVSLSFIDRNFRTQVSSILLSAQGITDENLELWAGENYRALTGLVNQKTIHHLLTNTPDEDIGLLNHMAPAKSVMVVFDTNLNIQYASDNKARAMDYSKLIKPESIARALEGDRVWILPQAADAHDYGPGINYPCVSFIAPVYELNTKELIGFVLIEREMKELFQSIFRQGQIGATGETYVVSKDGILLTPSRFEEDLLALNKIAGIDKSALYLKLKEGENTEAWTEPVATLLERTSGENVAGYAGYLGRETVGVWKWHEEYGIGVITEMQYDEAYFLNDRVSFYILIFSTGLMLIASISIVGVGIAQGKSDRFLSRLRDREREIRSLVESVTEGIIGLKDTADINYSNAVVQYLSGYDKTELLHLDIRNLFAEREGTPPERTIWPEDLEAVLKFGNSMAGRRLDLISKDGARTPVEMTAIAVRNAGSDASHVISFRDVSGWLRVQQNMISLKDKAEDNNRAKSVFLANMSHEIRTPLNGVVGALGLLEGRDSAENIEHKGETLKHSEIVKLAKVSADALLNVINDVLDISKLEEGKLTLSVSPCNVKEILSQVLMLEASLANDKGIAFTIDSRGLEDVWLSIDEGRVRQVLLNFVSNAIKFTEKGEVKIRMSAIDKGHEATVKFEVIDTGLGISEEMQQRLFGRFEQADNSVTRTTTGSGLGLAISQELVELMDGDIGVNSKEGEGSTFWFRLTAPKTQEAGDTSKETVDLRPSNILVAEDNPINKKIIEQILIRNGHACYIVENGKELLDHLALHNGRAAPYDVILMDLHMPIMGGEEATQHVQKSTEVWSDIPIIALTADTLGDRAMDLKASGFSEFVGKPIDINELFTAIKKVTRSRVPVLDADASVTVDSDTIKKPAMNKKADISAPDDDALDDLLDDI